MHRQAKSVRILIPLMPERTIMPEVAFVSYKQLQQTGSGMTIAVSAKPLLAPLMAILSSFQPASDCTLFLMPLIYVNIHSNDLLKSYTELLMR
jgi:hypothetical protein